MPYIITTTHPPSPLGVSARRSRDAAGIAAPAGLGSPTQTRRAVATLDEAQAEVIAAYEAASGKAVPSCFALRTPGGKIGPLLDGTTIEVEQVSFHDLRMRLQDGYHVTTHPDGELVAAFNEAQR